MTTLDSERAFAFLLGELPEAEAAALDEAVLLEPETHEQLEAFEAELVDAFVTGRLSPERRVRFEQRFGHAAGRLGFSRALLSRARKEPEPGPSVFARWWAALTTPRFAFGVLATAAALVLVWVALPHQASPARVTLVASEVRAAQPPPVLRLAGADAEVTFELALDDAPAAGASWKVEVQGPSGLVWSGLPSRAERVAVEVRVTGVRWRSGAHRLSLTSADSRLEYDVVLDVP